MNDLNLVLCNIVPGLSVNSLLELFAVLGASKQLLSIRGLSFGFENMCYQPPVEAVLFLN